MRPRLILSPMLLFVKMLRTVRTLRLPNEVQKFTTDVFMFREYQCKKRDILMF